MIENIDVYYPQKLVMNWQARSRQWGKSSSVENTMQLRYNIAEGREDMSRFLAMQAVYNRSEKPDAEIMKAEVGILIDYNDWSSTLASFMP